MVTGSDPTGKQEVVDDVAVVDSNVDAIKVVTDAIPDAGAMSSIAQGSDLATLDGKVALDSTVAKDATVSKEATAAKDSTVAKEATLSTVDGKVDTIDAFHDVPAVESIDNVVMSDVVGNKTDLVVVPYAQNNSLAAFLHTGYYHIHGAGFTYPDYVDPITLTGGAGAWNQTGTIVEIIPANAIIKDFDLHWIDIAAISGNGTIKIDIFAGGAGAEVQIGGTKVFRNAVQSQEGSKRIHVPQIPANTRISCRISDSTGGQLTCNVVAFDGHVYDISLT